MIASKIKLDHGIDSNLIIMINNVLFYVLFLLIRALSSL